MSTQTLSRRDLERALTVKCWKEPDFRRQVMQDPKAMLEGYLGQKLPDSVKIFIHEETPQAVHLTIPPNPSNVSELSDEELEKVAGGTDFAITIITAFVGLATVASVAAGVGGAVTQSQGW